MFGSTVRLTAVAAAIAVVLSLAFGAIGPAGAQEPARGETVTDRARPELDPLGIRTGGFLFYPQIGIAGRYDDNIFATDTLEDDDFITVVSPSLELRSNWNNHELNLFATGEIGRYSDFDTEDYEDFTVGFDGRVDVSRDSNISLGVSFAQFHEDRGDTAPQGTEPTEFDVLSADASLYRKFGRFSLGIDGGLQRFDFDATSAGSNDFRDRDELEGTLRLGYEIVPEYEAFVRGTYFERDYDLTSTRNSTGYEAVVGTAIDLTGVTTGELFAGYRSQNLDGVAFETIEGAQYGGEITWNASGLTTVNVLVERTIEETTLAGASGFFATHAGLSVDHELLRNLLLGADVNFTARKYEGITRDDDDTEVGLNAKYLLNRHLYITASYDFTSRNSNAPLEDFTKNVYFIQIQTQY